MSSPALSSHNEGEGLPRVAHRANPASSDALTAVGPKRNQWQERGHAGPRPLFRLVGKKFSPRQGCRED